MREKEKRFFVVLISTLIFILICELAWFAAERISKKWFSKTKIEAKPATTIMETTKPQVEETKQPESIVNTTIVDIYDLCITATKSKYIDLIANEVLINSQKYNLPPWFIYAVMETESLNGFTQEVNHVATNRYGAIGLFQNTPGGSLGDWNRLHPKAEQYTKEDMLDIRKNIEVGCWYLALVRDQYLKGLQITWGDLYIAYNVGATNFKRYRVDYYNKWDPVHNCGYNAYERFCWYAVKQYNHFNGTN